MPRKLSAIRQFSLQCESPPPSSSTRRSSLKKQQSEELKEYKEDIGIRISLSAKALRTPQHPIKVAWGDDDGPQNVQEVKHAKPQPFRRHSTEVGVTGGKTSLYSRQDLAQKLHLAWQERENTKNKLNIFLAHNFQEKPDNCDQNYESPRTQPKLMQPLLLQQQENQNTNGCNLKQIFQKHLKKSKISSPVGSDSESINQAVVVVPIIERSKSSQNQNVGIKAKRPQTACVQIQKAENDQEPRPDSSPLSPRPNLNNQQTVQSPSASKEFKESRSRLSPSAAQKRSMFQKRTNSAFTSMNSNSGCSTPIASPSVSSGRQYNTRPPLVRASSLPTSTKSDIQVKTRLRKKIKVAKRGKQQLKDGEDERKISDVVTMVSLVSPSESEGEDLDIKQDQQAQPPTKHSPKKTSEKHFSLRKTVKQVSFQHSSIHAVRSFSASFPARRASVGANLLLDSAAKKLQKSLEKRTQPDEGLAEAKRRFLQTENEVTKDITEEKLIKTPTDSSVIKYLNNSTCEESASKNKENQEDGESLKEKKCWETYCRMTKSGLNVSFDTILRGMLTPTEYRLRRRLSLQCTEEETNQTEINHEINQNKENDNCSNDFNTNKQR